jgi:hypothetical protein
LAGRNYKKAHRIARRDGYREKKGRESVELAEKREMLWNSSSPPCTV